MLVIDGQLRESDESRTVGIDMRRSVSAPQSRLRRHPDLFSGPVEPKVITPTRYFFSALTSRLLTTSFTPSID